VHTCGLPPEEAASRMNPASIFGSLVGGVLRRAAKEPT
jgi:hypothetical protein